MLSRQLLSSWSFTGAFFGGSFGGRRRFPLYVLSSSSMHCVFPFCFALYKFDITFIPAGLGGIGGGTGDADVFRIENVDCKHDHNVKVVF